MISPSIRKAVYEWQERMQALEEKMDAMREVFGSNPEGPFQEAVYAMAGGYTHAIAQLLEFPEDFLTSWWLEDNFGETSAQMGLPGEPMRTIANLDDLLQFIADDNARSEDKAPITDATPKDC